MGHIIRTFTSYINVFGLAVVSRPESANSLVYFTADPDIMPKVQVDRGAIKFVLSGANIMCPGLTSAGARLDTELEVDTPVAVMAEGKENALAVGVLKMSTSDM